MSFFEFPDEILDYEINDEYLLVKTKDGIFKIVINKSDFECIDFTPISK